MKSLLRISLVIVFLTGNVLAAPTPENLATATQPFTYENIVSFFKQAHLHPTEYKNAAPSFSRADGRMRTSTIIASS